MNMNTCLNCVYLCKGCSVIQTCNFDFGRCRFEDRSGDSIRDPQNHTCANFAENSLSDPWRGNLARDDVTIEEYLVPLVEESVDTFVSFG